MLGHSQVVSTSPKSPDKSVHKKVSFSLVRRLLCASAPLAKLLSTTLLLYLAANCVTGEIISEALLNENMLGRQISYPG